jgi:hypothetical protein
MANNERYLDPESYLKMVHRYFEQGIILKNQIAAQQLQLQSLTSLSYSLSSPGNISMEKVQTSTAQEAAFEKKVEKKTELEEKLQKAIDLMLDLQQQMIRIINQYTEGMENLILTERYINGLEPAKVAAKLNYCPRQIKRKTEAAMPKIILPEDAIWINWRTLV